MSCLVGCEPQNYILEANLNLSKIFKHDKPKKACRRINVPSGNSFIFCRLFHEQYGPHVRTRYDKLDVTYMKGQQNLVSLTQEDEANVKSLTKQDVTLSILFRKHESHRHHMLRNKQTGFFQVYGLIDISIYT
jgi:hypothetical protein